MALALATVGGVAQAHSLTVLRRSALDDRAPTPLFARIHRQARRAAFLRASIGVLTFALVIVAAVIID
jgi:hypothetical protein